MSVVKLHRVVEQVRNACAGKNWVRTLDLDRAIMKEFDTSCRRTIIEKRWGLVRLGWIKTIRRHFLLTNKDQTGRSLSDDEFSARLERERKNKKTGDDDDRLSDDERRNAESGIF